MPGNKREAKPPCITGDFTRERRDTARKGMQGMPRRLVPKKDVVHSEMLRSGVCSRKQPEMSEWGNPRGVKPAHRASEGHRGN